jgi:hypothetical protein
MRILTDCCAEPNYLGGTTDKKGELDFFASPEFSLTRASVDLAMFVFTQM